MLLGCTPLATGGVRTLGRHRSAVGTPSVPRGGYAPNVPIYKRNELPGSEEAWKMKKRRRGWEGVTCAGG